MPAWDQWRPRDLSEVEETERPKRRRRYAQSSRGLVDVVRGDAEALDGATDLPLDGSRTNGTPLDGGAGGDRTTWPEGVRRVLDLDTELEEGLTVREVLAGFTPARLGLPDIPLADVPAYLEDHVPYRPWLRMAEGQDPLVQRVYAVLDSGHGHLLQRHEGYGGDGAQFERAAYLRDPAQRGDLAHLRSVDGFKRRDRQHGCGIYATRIHDPVAFATAVARIQEHPAVREALDTPYTEGKRPETIESVTLEEVLGPDGHHACSGFYLTGADHDKARADRQKWVEAIRAAVPRHSAEPVAVLAERAREKALAAGLSEPVAAPIESFEGGRLRIAFKPNRAKDGYELLTMFASPFPSPNASPEGSEERL